MTLQEAIKHAKEVSSKECSECKKEHEQLAECPIKIGERIWYGGYD